VPTTDFSQHLALTEQDRVLGTLAYLSPEALLADPPEPRFDLWSLSVVLLESLTAINPFFAKTRFETANRIRSMTPAELRQFTRGLPESVASLFADLLASGMRPPPKLRQATRPQAK